MHMKLHPNPAILEAVRQGHNAREGDSNPHSQDTSLKEYLGWQEGYESERRHDLASERWAALPWWRRVLCSMGLHLRRFIKEIPGRPHIDCQTRNIAGRDRSILVYECPHCGDRVCDHLDG